MSVGAAPNLSGGLAMAQMSVSCLDPGNGGPGGNGPGGNGATTATTATIVPAAIRPETLRTMEATTCSTMRRTAPTVATCSII